MRSTLLLLLAAFVLFSCKEPTDPELEAITALEQEMEAGASAEQIQELTGLYESYVANHPEAMETNAQLLHKAAFLQFTNHRYASALRYLKQAMHDYYASAKTPDNGLFMASLYQTQLKNQRLASAAYAAFLEAFPGHEKAAFVRDTALTEPSDIHTAVDTLRSGIFNERTQRYDSQVANDFIGACEIYGLFLPKDPQTPEILYEAARTAGYIRSFPKAVELYEWVYDRYPDYAKASQALFMMAFTYDNEMQNVEKASALYGEFLEKYPGDTFSDDVQVLLQNLGKSEGEVLQGLQQVQ